MAKPEASTRLDDTVAMLGIRVRIRSDLELLPVIRRGLPASALESVSKKMELGVLATAEALGLAKRTIARRIQEKRALDSEESERVVRLARVLSEANDVLGSLDKARRWLQRPNRALGGEVPLHLLDTDIGTNAVITELGRIDHGVFA